MVGMRDVAKQAGVSLSTVSLVVNGTGYVSDDMRDRVQRAHGVAALCAERSCAQFLAESRQYDRHHRADDPASVFCHAYRRPAACIGGEGIADAAVFHRRRSAWRSGIRRYASQAIDGRHRNGRSHRACARITGRRFIVRLSHSIVCWGRGFPQSGPTMCRAGG